MKIEIPEAVRQIIGRLRDNGYEGYIVGGCVRDMLLGRQPEDWDITTSALPHEVKALFRRTIDTGIQHGTVTVMVDKEGYEVTTYRVDGTYSDGRHPDQVTFTPSLTEDLKRRDFTINAMAYDPQTGLVDEFGGQGDLRRGMIRCVGKAIDRFSEDALRMLRAIRFCAQLGFDIDEEAMAAIRVLAKNLEKVSRERVQVELTKLLLSPRPERIGLVYESGLAPFVGEEFACVGGGAARTREESARTGKEFARVGIPALSHRIPGKKYLRWAAFLRNAGPEQAKMVLKGLKLDNDTIAKVQTLVSWYSLPLEGEKPGIRRTMSAMGPELYGDLLDLKEALGEANGVWPAEESGSQESGAGGISLEQIREKSREILADGDCLTLKELAVSGRDVMEAGNISGPSVGKYLSRLLELVLEEPGRNTREYLLQHLSEWFIM